MSSFGRCLRIHTFGESHCPAVGGILDGFPANFTIDITQIQSQLDRRRAVGSISTSRQESDRVEILSGLERHLTLGTPIGFMVKNKDIRPEDYKLSQGVGTNYVPRPSHADFTYLMKYGIHASSGGGRSSARETVSRVIGGSIAEQYLWQRHGCRIVAWVSQIGDLVANIPPGMIPTREQVDSTAVRCPDKSVAASMEAVINKLKSQGDSIGGVINCAILNPPVGIGEPAFDKLEAVLAHAMMSIPATKGFEIGEGFKVATMSGSDHNDSFVNEDGTVKPGSNRAGGILGGISSGQPIQFRVAFKPPSTIGKPQKTVDISGNPTVLEVTGRHDPCVVHRAVSIVESMSALVILDQFLLQRTRAEVVS